MQTDLAGDPGADAQPLSAQEALPDRLREDQSLFTDRDGGVTDVDL